MQDVEQCLYFCVHFRAHHLFLGPKQNSINRGTKSLPVHENTHEHTHRSLYQRKSKGANPSKHMGCIWLWLSVRLSSETEDSLSKVLFLVDFQHIYNLIGNVALPVTTV